MPCLPTQASRTLYLICFTACRIQYRVGYSMVQDAVSCRMQYCAVLCKDWVFSSRTYPLSHIPIGNRTWQSDPRICLCMGIRHSMRRSDTRHGDSMRPFVDYQSHASMPFSTKISSLWGMTGQSLLNYQYDVAGQSPKWEWGFFPHLWGSERPH